MIIYSFIAFSALTIAIVSTLFAMIGKYQYYWISAIAIYIFSFLAGFSIGQMTVGFTFIPLMMAVGHSFCWIKNKTQGIIFICLGILIGLIAVFFVDDAWLFFPFWLLS